MKASKQLVEQLIEPSEGFESAPYLCPAKVPSIGYGSTRYANGTRVTLQDPHITKTQATQLVLDTLGEYEDAVNRYVKVTLTQNQFDALVDFAYNVGIGALQKSTLLQKLNSGDYTGASNEFGKWVHGGGAVLPGLVTRRKAEKTLFLKP
jgi:lysozyme